MATTPAPANKSFGDILLSIPKQALYLILIVLTSVPLFFDMTIPLSPKDETKDLYRELMSIPEGSTVIIQSDWTNSTRGESRGQFEALVRILMRKKVKFAVVSVADPQAPQAARDVIDILNQEVPEAERYRRWEDWINIGFFPNAEALGQAMRADVRKAFGGRQDVAGSQGMQDIFKSPVMSNVNKIGDVSALIVVTGTKSIIIALERLAKDVKMLGMVTGVMGPETLNYYSSKQLKGLSAGLKGVAEMEKLMESGIDGEESVGNFKGKKNIDKGNKYILTLHVAIFLLIGCVVIGNIGVLLGRKKA